LKEKPEAAWQPSKSDKSERLLQITCALLFAERGLTKAELFRSIPAYIEAVKSGTTDDSLNRMFERDKTDLRSTGIQVFTPNPTADAEEICYVIADDTFVWPQHADLNAKHLQLLELAAQVWSQASLESDANQALVRLKALGIEPAAADLIGFAPRIETHEPSFTPLNTAIDECLEVSFDYRKPSGELSKRQVQPWSLQNIDGQWLLQCFDLGAKEHRNFLLKRIVSKVQFLKDGEADKLFTKPSDELLQAAIDDLQNHIHKQICELRVKPDSQAWFHFRLDDSLSSGSQTISFNYMDLALLAEELRDFAMDIEVLKPKELDDIIRAGFEKVASDHA
jgi:predicted DNA-binding transcriptional regulator YafY